MNIAVQAYHSLDMVNSAEERVSNAHKIPVIGGALKNLGFNRLNRADLHERLYSNWRLDN